MSFSSIYHVYDTRYEEEMGPRKPDYERAATVIKMPPAVEPVFSAYALTHG